MITLFHIYLIIGFLLWNLGMFKDGEIRGWGFLKGLGCMFFTTFFWGPIVLGYLILKR